MTDLGTTTAFRWGEGQVAGLVSGYHPSPEPWQPIGFLLPRSPTSAGVRE